MTNDMDRKLSERKTVAVFISALYEGMVRETVEGLLDAAREENVKLIFFTSFADNFTSRNYSLYQDYDIGDFVVYLLPDLKDYDALISFDTYMTGSFVGPINRLKKSAPCPVVTLGTVQDCSCSVVNDQTASFSELIRHVVDHHGCRDLVHVAGPTERSFCLERIQIFRDTLSACGLPCGDDRIFFGELRPESGPPVVEQILARYAEKGGRPLPEAIICVNDYTAIGVIQALEDRGFHVPGDVIVTGYDDILRAQINEPAVTTSAQPFARVGRTGMEALMKILRGEPVDARIYVPGVLCLRQSCGCEPLRVYKRNTLQNRYISIVSNLEALSLSNTNLILGAALCETLEDIYAEIEKGCLRETGFRGAVLCLLDDWDVKKMIQHRYTLKEESFSVVCGVWNGQSVRRQRLPQGMLIPDEIMEDNKPCYIFPIHHLQYFLGYFIVDPDLQGMEQLHIKAWLTSVSTVLLTWYFRHQLTNTVKELDHLSQTDMLTGLYNRRGYYRFFEQYYQACLSEGAELAVFLIDMNRMKKINDDYGHAEGDYCLSVIADALRDSAHLDEICIRTGGDEFVVLAKHYDQEKADTYIRLVREKIDHTIQRAGKPYTVSISVGCYRSVPRRSGSLSVQENAELFLKRADKAMYKEKREMKRKN